VISGPCSYIVQQLELLSDDDQQQYKTPMEISDREKRGHHVTTTGQQRRQDCPLRVKQESTNRNDIAVTVTEKAD
jgi:hypothetical protein